MTKKFSALLGVMLVMVFAVFALASSSSDDNKATQGAGTAESIADSEQTLGDYSVEIKNARITKDYEDKAVVVITYEFSNNSKAPAAFYTAFDDSVYQNGVGLNGAYFLDDSDPYDSANQTKDIKPGASIDVDVAYLLNDSETDVEVEVSELFSFDNKIISKTFIIK